MRIAALTLALTLTSTSSAWALSCFDGPTHAMPEDASVDVPVNVLPRIQASFVEEGNWDVILTGPDQSVVAGQTQVIAMGGSLLLTFVPDADLAANTEYSMSAAAPDSEEFGFISSFVTGAQRDVQAPSAAVIDSVRHRKDNTRWGPTETVSIDVEGSAEPLMYRMELIAGPHSAEGLDPAEDTVAYAFDYAGLVVGNSTCFSNGSIPNLEGGSVVVTAIDLAGNESDAASVAGDAISSSGCSSLGSSGPIGLLGAMGLALGLIGLRRRRRT